MQDGGKAAGMWPGQHHLLSDIQKTGLRWELQELCHLLRPHGGATPVPKSQAVGSGGVCTASQAFDIMESKGSCIG